MGRFECGCGSGESKRPLSDGYGIFLCYVCDSCHDEKVRHYRLDIFDSYDCDEEIEPEESL